MKPILTLFILLGSLIQTGCAVVTTTAMVGAAAISVTTTAVGVTYEATKTIGAGAIAAGSYAYEAATSNPDVSKVQVQPLTTPQAAVVTPLSDN
ncbi:hypothetical protein [Chitinibacter sp. GC72]|uniref:hypothetical protein n=1 Tax=Chitinibacter sp. GC72 TaxID=1526917 RepID=UPI0012FBCB85|nr:hypothetical protein [Chitinibacter sp. GC72]